MKEMLSKIVLWIFQHSMSHFLATQVQWSQVHKNVFEKNRPKKNNHKQKVYRIRVSKKVLKIKIVHSMILYCSSYKKLYMETAKSMDRPLKAKTLVKNLGKNSSNNVSLCRDSQLLTATVRRNFFIPNVSLL